MSCQTIARSVIAALILAARAGADPPAGAESVLAEVGAPIFQRYCASCHGMAGRGDGPSARALHPKPADLTGIASRRAGKFPSGEIARFIDGRFELPAHGSRAMPVWGERFGADIPESDLAESVARGDIASLVEYLKSIQRPPLARTAAGGKPADAKTLAIMSEVFDALHHVLPLSLDERRFSDPAQRAAIRKSLATLSRNAGQLAQHTGDRDESFAFLSSSLAREAGEIERRYAAGRYREAQFELHQFTENCVACHSRLPDPVDSQLSKRFLDESEIAALPLPERAQLAMATRQFDRALDAQEAMLVSPGFDVSSLDLLTYLDDYIEVNVRVKRDFARPARALEAFAKRSDVRSGLRDDVRAWVADLRDFDARAPVEGLAPARELVEQTEALAPERGEHALLVRYEVASGALLRYVSSQPDGDRDVAEAYYWLGVIESRIGRSFWLSQTEPYLEAAIRRAPGDPIAERSYALLEDFVIGGYTGSSGEHVPPDVKAWLAELQTLIRTTHGEDRS